ncbi:YicC/YloC family endoribonuclease [Algoriphagus namhaensis]
MIKSMTGFGNAGFEDDRRAIHVEVKTLNSKFIDFSLRAPRQFSEKENELRTLVQNVLERGKVSLTLDISSKSGADLPVSINEDLFQSYFQKYQSLAQKVGQGEQEIFKLALQSPNVITNITPEAEDSGEDWNKVLEVVKEALANCDAFRQDEGNALEAKLSGNIAAIRAGLQEIERIEWDRKSRIKDKIKNHFSEWLDENQFDSNRFEQELIYYFEKLDITEEIVRLGTHLDYFDKCLQEDTNQGKKLGFISQEIGREINTIGSKANDAVMQKQVILMKDELEKIKEQTMNVL